jgi:hypothetical protein
VRRNFSVETILPPHKVQTLVTTARTIDQERWEVSALGKNIKDVLTEQRLRCAYDSFSWILDNCLLVAFSITIFHQKIKPDHRRKYWLSIEFCRYLGSISCFANISGFYGKSFCMYLYNALTSCIDMLDFHVFHRCEIIATLSFV